MKNNKYYTPELSEFHIGFEFEYLNKTKWKKQIVTLNNFPSFPYGYMESLETLEYGVRVKFLDKKDIESFGFKYNKKQDLYISNKTYLGVSCGDDKKLCIFYDSNDNNMLIYFRDNTGYEFERFDGFIKNKSELKNLLEEKLKISTNE